MSTPSGKDGGLLIGIAYVSAYILVTSGANILEQQTFLQHILGDKSFSGLICLIYEKVLKMAHSSNNDFGQGEIINFMQVDADSVFIFVWSFPPVAKLPIQLIFGLSFLFYYFGFHLFPAILISVLFIISNFFIAVWMTRVKKEALEKKDKRMNITTEVVNTIKILKLNSWVENFVDKMSKLRQLELI